MLAALVSRLAVLSRRGEGGIFVLDIWFTWQPIAWSEMTCGESSICGYFLLVYHVATVTYEISEFSGAYFITQ